MKKFFSKKVAVLVLAAVILGTNLGFSNTSSGTKLGAAKNISNVNLMRGAPSTTQSSTPTIVAVVATVVAVTEAVVAVTEAVVAVTAAAVAVQAIEGFATPIPVNSREASLSALD